MNGWSQSSFSAGSFTENQLAQRTDSRSTNLGVNMAGKGGFLGIGGQRGGYSVVGLNTNSIEAMRESIRKYVEDIIKYLDEIAPLTDASKAFKSEVVQTAVGNYMAKMKEYCINLTSQLLAFSDKLEDVRKTYEANMQALASTVDEGTSSFGAGERYAEQFQSASNTGTAGIGATVGAAGASNK